MKVLHSAPGLEDLWQLRNFVWRRSTRCQERSSRTPFDDQAATMPNEGIAAPAPGSGAPPAPAHNGVAHWLKISAQRDGTFTVTNARNGFAKTYAAVTP